MAQTEEEKRRAKDDRDSWKRVSVWSTSLGTGLSVAAGIGALGPIGLAAGGPVFLICAVSALALRTNAELKGVEASRKVEDPPRVDFREPTFVRSVLPFRDAFGDSGAERALATFARATVETVSLESAMVTAFERESGARLFGADEFVALRGRERYELRIAAGRSNLQLAFATQVLAERLETEVLTDSSLLELSDVAPRGVLDVAGPQEDLFALVTAAFPVALATVEAAGYPSSSLRGVEPVLLGETLSDAGDALIRELRVAADASAAYGRFLLGDEPPDGGQGAPMPPGPPEPSFDPRWMIPASGDLLQLIGSLVREVVERSGNR